jgi:ABC-type transport system involved in multi-copper enzyme maturation permease subunit
MRRMIFVEWLKMRRYWLTWALLALLIGILALQVNGKLNSLEELQTEVATGLSAADGEPLTPFQIEGNSLLIDITRNELRYPAFIGTVARLSTAAGWFIIIVIVAVMGGEDFGRQTLRGILSRGVGRSEYLIARTLAMWIAVGMIVLLIAILSAAGGLLVHKRVSGDPISWAGMGEAFLWVLRAWLTYLPFIVVILFWAVLGRNAGPAMGVGIGIHTLELLYGLALPFVGMVIANAEATGGQVPLIYRWQVNLYHVTLGFNADIFLNWGSPHTRDAIYLAKTIGLNSETFLTENPWRAAVVLLVYTALFLGWTIWILRRRDVTYGS